ncbi:unnamed protein product [Mytilus edulis]|uniref:Endonuclease/exonuclease/phosphatase domain-containing protein n=1 Tax=Mytilus edulis TaxID=6550 RepID=A0A8S3ULV8_MYTED|nr:unnamed protein product [Mytilus edulis]
MPRKKSKPKKRFKTMSSTTQSTPTTMSGAKDKIKNTSSKPEPITSTPIATSSIKPHHEQKRKREALSSDSSADSFVLDLDSEQIKVKIQRIIEESVNVATEAAIQAAKKTIQTGLESIFSHRIDILESRIFDLEKNYDKQLEWNSKLSKDLVELLNDNKAKTLKISTLHSELNMVHKDLKQHRFQINETAQYTRKNTVRIFGIVQTEEKENTHDVVQKLLKEKLSLDNIDIEIAHRIGPVKDSDENVNTRRPIICKMLRRTDKIKVIASRRKLKGQKVSISDELTKLNFELLKSLQEHELIDQAWSYNGKIFAKHKNNDIKRIIDIADVSRVFSNRTKLDEIEFVLCNELQYDVICISETWLKPDISFEDIKIDNYNTYRRDRADGFGYGGVAIYVSDRLYSMRRQELEIQGLEFLCIEVKTKDKSILVSVCYRPPNVTANERKKFTDSFTAVIENMKSHSPDVCLILGDFNDRCVSWFDSHSHSELGLTLFNLAHRYGLSQLIDEPTRYTDSNATLLDLIFTDNERCVSDFGVSPPLLNLDHCIIFCKLSLKVSKSRAFQRRVWDYKSADFNSLNTALLNAPFDSAYEIFDDVNDIASYTSDLITSACSEFIPNKIVTIRHRDKPWMSNEVRRAIRKRDRCFKKYQRTRRDEDKLYHIVARREVNRLKRDAKQRYEINIIRSFSRENLNPRKFWSLSKSVLGYNSDRTIPPLKDNMNLISDDLEKAELLNCYFSAQMHLGQHENDLPALPPLSFLTVERLQEIVAVEEDVLKYLRQSNPHKSCGPDGISNHILKYCAHSLYKPLTKLFNFSLHSGVYPSLWKVSNVCPVYKNKGDKNIMSNYRPIALLSSVSKILEKVIYKAIYEFCEFNDLLISENSGFKKNDSTVNQLITITHEIYKSLDSGKDVCTIFLDVSKAFDKKKQIPHYPPLILNNVNIKRVTCHKHLGLILNDKLSWTDHIADICKKCHNKLNTILRMRHILPRLCIEKLYKTFVRSLLDYADVIYDNCTSADSANIEHVQRRACIISTGAIRVTKHVTLLKEVGLELLKTRRQVHRLTYLYKIKNHLVPDYLCNFHPLFHHNTENYNLRRHANLIPIRSRTVAYYNSFLLATIRDWNSLSAELITATSLASFKRLLKKNLNLCSKKIYSRGHGYEKKIHTRLRLGLSALNDHLYKYNLTLNRFCDFCPGNCIENTEHYLIHCARYTNYRITLLLGIKNLLCPDINIAMLRDLCPNYLSKILIEGSDDLSDDTNLEMFECVFRFIKSSNRFSR